MLQCTENYILVVDDQKENRDLLSAYFKKCRQNHLIASGGEECIKLIEGRNDISLILMDVKMKGMSGTEAMKIIKSRYNIPVIAVTAFAMEGDKEALLEEGFDDYISKPIDIDTLGSKLESIIKKI